MDTIHVNLDRTGAAQSPALCGITAPASPDADVVQMTEATCKVCVVEGHKLGLKTVSEIFDGLDF